MIGAVIVGFGTTGAREQRGDARNSELFFDALVVEPVEPVH